MNSIETIFEWLLAASLRASVLAVAVLGIQFVLRHRLPAAWRHALWLPMLAVLILPVLPEAPFALFPQKTAAPVLIEMAVKPAAPAVITAPAAATLTMAADLAPALPAAPTPIIEAAPVIQAAPIIQAAPALTSNVNFLAILWLAGAGVVLGAGWIGYHRNMRRIRATATAPDRILQASIAEAAHEAGLSRAPRTWVSSAVSSPAVTGFLRPLLLLPAGFPAGFSAAETRLILLHEFSHLKRLDLPINWLMCLLQAMHWFNPLLWFAFARMRADRESACDARVLSIDATDRRAEYGGALLKLQCVAPSQALSLGFVGIFEKGSEIKARIREISAHRSGRAAWRLTGACILTLLMVFGVTKGQEAERDTKSNAVPVEKQFRQAEAQLDIRKEGAFGFPQHNATVLCDSQELRVSVCNYRSHLYVQAIIWKDSDPALGVTIQEIKTVHPDPVLDFTTSENSPIGDYATIVFDTDANGKATPNLDRSYFVNPWPKLEGLHYLIKLGDNRSTSFKATSQGRGSIRYAETPTGKVRVDCIVVPLAELGLEPGEQFRFAYYGYSSKPELSLNSIGYENEGIYYPHQLPLSKFHEVTVSERPVMLDLKSIPDGRDDAKMNPMEPLSLLGPNKDAERRRVMEKLAAADSATAKVDERGASESLELKVLKVFAAKDGDAIYRAYLVKWKDQEVVVSDALAMSNYKEGDTITVLAMNGPYPQGKMPLRLQSFTIIPSREAVAKELLGEASTRAADSATAKVDERSTTERLELKVLKVFAAKDGDAIYREYLVKWKDQEVVVSDELVSSNNKEGDTIGVLVINSPNSKGKKSIRLLDFSILPPPAPTAEEVLEKAFK